MFVAFKSSHTFSAMAIDLAYEQANTVIKGEGVAIGVTEGPSAIRRWMVAGHGAKVAKVKVKHNEQTARAQRQFFEKVGKLYSIMKEMENPIQKETADLLTLNTKIIATQDAGEKGTSHYQTGDSHFKGFKGGLDKCDEGPTKKNKVDFFQHILKKFPMTSSKTF